MFSAPRPLVLLVAAAGTAAAPATVRAASNHEVTIRGTSVDWRFHAGGTVAAAPAVGADGTAYLGTSDGSIEAIGPDGVLRWSVTLDGSVAWAPAFEEGRLYVATTAQKVHSFLPSGVRGWVLRAPVRVATEPVLSSWGFVFGGADGSVWAASSRGYALWHAEIGHPLSAAPGVSGRRIVVGTATGEAVFLDGASRRFVARLGDRVRAAPVVFRDGSAAVLAGSSLYRLDPRASVLWRLDDVDWFGSDGERMCAVNGRGELVRVAGNGATSPSIPLGVVASGMLAIGWDGTAFVPSESGDVVVVRLDGSVTAVNVSRVSLHRPVLDPARHRVLAASGDGTVAAISLGE